MQTQGEDTQDNSNQTQKEVGDILTQAKQEVNVFA